MTTPVTKRVTRLGLAAVFSLCLVFAGTASASADTMPYFKVFGGDVWAGGWFTAPNNPPCDTATTSNYQDNTFSDSPTYTPDNRYGGILTYSKQKPSGDYDGGASADFGVYALGLIESTPASNYGFASAGAQTGGASDALSFANSGSDTTVLPGTFAGGVRQVRCIPDYYGSKLPSPLPDGLTGAKLTGSTADGTYYQTGGIAPSGIPFDLVDDTVTIPAGRHITIFVKGSVYIGSNITYGNFTADHVPKFALVVQGSIYIGKDVTQLDGLYIAQPDPANANPLSTDDGDIWTCHPKNTQPVLNTYPKANCGAKLVVNGALIAKQVNFLRTNGDIAAGSAKANEPASSDNISEVINYTPAMVMGGSFFQDEDDSNSAPDIDSLISLPPVF